jgi:hypothetical protein
MKPDIYGDDDIATAFCLIDMLASPSAEQRPRVLRGLYFDHTSAFATAIARITVTIIDIF